MDCALPNCWCWSDSEYKAIVSVQPLMGVNCQVFLWFFLHFHLVISLFEVNLSEPLLSCKLNENVVDTGEWILFCFQWRIYGALVVAIYSHGTTDSREKAPPFCAQDARLRSFRSRIFPGDLLNISCRQILQWLQLRAHLLQMWGKAPRQ